MASRDDEKGPRRASRRSLSFRIGSSLLTGALALVGRDRRARPKEKVHVNPGPPVGKPTSGSNGESPEELGSSTKEEGAEVAGPRVHPDKVESMEDVQLESPEEPPSRTTPEPVKTTED